MTLKPGNLFVSSFTAYFTINWMQMLSIRMKMPSIFTYFVYSKFQWYVYEVQKLLQFY